MTVHINKNDFGDGQQRNIHNSLAAFMEELVQNAPQLGPHLLSGGTIEIKTMSGAQLRLGFSPTAGGLIVPGGIIPTTQKPFGGRT